MIYKGFCLCGVYIGGPHVHTAAGPLAPEKDLRFLRSCTAATAFDARKHPANNRELRCTPRGALPVRPRLEAAANLATMTRMFESMAGFKFEEA
jgi:hypothetical protein